MKVPYHRPPFGMPPECVTPRRNFTPPGPRFYNKRAWRDGLRKQKLRRNPFCEFCLRWKQIVPATLVHHDLEIDEHPEAALDLSNLISLCWSCHSKLHRKRQTRHEPTDDSR